MGIKEIHKLIDDSSITELSFNKAIENKTEFFTNLIIVFSLAGISGFDITLGPSSLRLVEGAVKEAEEQSKELNLDKFEKPYLKASIGLFNADEEDIFLLSDKPSKEFSNSFFINNLENYDIIVICVDNPIPRRLVHQTTTKWLDVRCMGDAFITLDFTMCMDEIINLTPNHEPQSCQYSNALQTQNIQFGYLMAATFSCQWLFQMIRQHYNLNSVIPNSKILSLTFGELGMGGE